MDISEDQLSLPGISMSDFTEALSKIKPSVGQEEIVKYKEFTKEYGEQG